MANPAMRPIVSVTKATARKLVEVATVKSDLRITGSSDDTWLGLAIDRASAFIEGWLGYSLVKEAVTETWRLSGFSGPLILTRRPVCSSPTVTATLDGVSLTAGTDFEIDYSAGLLWRLDDDTRIDWGSGKLVVGYSAGFLLPGDANRDLPPAIEWAALQLVKAAWHARDRDPMSTREAVPGEIEMTFGGSYVGAGMPDSVREALAPFRAVWL